MPSEYVTNVKEIVATVHPVIDRTDSELVRVYDLSGVTATG
jgi:hypothetical protein